jgi:hypothetical protein
MVVVPSPDGAAYTTLEARVGGTAGDLDVALQASGIAVHRVDQRPDAECFTVVRLGLDRCSGLDRRVQPFGGHADSYAHVFGNGTSVDLGGVTMTVTAAGPGRFSVRLDGTVAAFPAIPACGVYSACLGTAIMAQTASTFVCLVGAGRSAGRDAPASIGGPLPSDVTLMT